MFSYYQKQTACNCQDSDWLSETCSLSLKQPFQKQQDCKLIEHVCNNSGHATVSPTVTVALVFLNSLGFNFHLNPHRARKLLWICFYAFSFYLYAAHSLHEPHYFPNTSLGRSDTFDAFCVTGADLFVLQRKQEWPMRYKKTTKKQGDSVTQKLRKQQWFILFALFHGKLSFVPEETSSIFNNFLALLI